MKKTHKQLLGFAGLVVVAAITVFAAFLPGPGALATSSSVTDTIVVRVVADTPNVSISNPDNGKSYVYPDQTISYSYENVNHITVTIEYTDLDGNTRTDTIEDVDTGAQPGSGEVALNLLNDYGYGNFVIKVVGQGEDGLVPDEDIVEFSFLPVTATAENNENTGDVDVKLEYDENNEDIDYIEINVYDKDGNLVEPLSPVKVPRPQKDTTLPFSEYGLPDGEYTISVTAYDKNGNQIQPPYFISINYVAPAEIPVPNTGNITGGTGISQSDYVISGLLVFFLVGIGGVILVGKNRQDKRRR